MQVTIIGVYEDLAAAQATRDELRQAGVSDVHLDRESQETEQQPSQRGQGGVKGFFKSLFGSDEQQDASLYEDAIGRGNYVLTVVTGEENIDQTAEVMNRHSPLNLSGSGASGAPEYLDAEETYSSDVTAPAATQSQGTSSTQSIPVIEEELKIGKRTFERGGVRVYQRVVEQPIREEVQLREEHVTVERTPANRPATEADLQAFKEGTIELRETAEEAVVEKTPRVVEEIRLEKDTTQRTEQISDTVRRTEVDIEPAQRSQYEGTYGSGQQYDAYAPAYQLGSSAYADPRYRGRGWNEIEPDVRRDWEQSSPNSTWDEVKAAVRHAWERAGGR
jgi:uncharacterized protein (TIGR02271 family)